MVSPLSMCSTGQPRASPVSLGRAADLKSVALPSSQLARHITCSSFLGVGKQEAGERPGALLGWMAFLHTETGNK